MSIVKVLYQTVLRRPSRFFVVVAVSSLFFERTIDIGIENLYDSINRGVSKSFLHYVVCIQIINSILITS